MATNNSINANSTTPLPIVDGGTQVTSVTTAPAATAFAGWDANKNLTANNHIESYATTATAAGTTTLTVASAYQQFFTGSTTQTVVLPVTSTLVLGQSFLVVNNSSGVVTVQSSGANTITAMAAGTQSIFTCILTSGTTASSWNSDYSLNTVGVSSITGTANQVIASSSTGAVTLSLPQSIATTSAVTFGSVAFSPTTSGNVGTTTNDNAATGIVGEYITANASAVSLSNATAKTITSISLTAGDWDVWGEVKFTPAGTTTVSNISGGVSSTNNGAEVNTGFFSLNLTFTTGQNQYMSCAPTRKSLSGTTTIYFVAQSAFATSTMTADATISARRMR